MSKCNRNDNLAKAFKTAIKNPAERARLVDNCPELKSALAFYEKNESNFSQNASSNKYAQVVLKALKENIFFQIKEEGPASFDESAKAHT